MACITTLILARPPQTSVFIHPGTMDPGEQFLHPELSDGMPAWYMPITPVFAALLKNHALPHQRPYFVTATFCLCLLLAFSLGCLLHSPACGFISSILSIFLYRLEIDFEQLVYSAVLLFVGNFLAVSFRSGLVKNLWAGLAIGISLFVKSVLLLFPLVISAYAALARPFFRNFFKNLVPLALAPALVILLWGCAHYAASGKIVFLEDGRRAHLNIVSGALGLIRTVEGNEHRLAGISSDDNVLLWAAGEIGAHPFRYGLAYFKRLWFLVSMHPVLFLAGLFGLWRLRKNKGCIMVGLLAGYFLLIHCLMTVGERYVIPFWFLLCPLASCSLDCVYHKKDRDPENRKTAMMILWPCSALFFAAFLYTGYLVCTYPVSRRVTRRVKGLYLNAVARNPNSSWAWNKLGDYYMEKGDMDNAVHAYKTSYLLNPILGEQDYIVALFVKGDYKNVTVDNLPYKDFLSLNTREDHFIRLIKSLVLLEEGRYDKAVEAFKKIKPTHCFFRKATTPYEQKLLKRMCDNEPGPENNMTEILLKLPPERRLKLEKKLPRISADNTELLSRTAMEPEEDRRDDKARPAAKHPPTRQSAIHRFIKKWHLFKAFAEGGGQSDSRTKKTRAALLTDRGVKKALDGLNAEAINNFEKAINADPHYLPAYISLGAVYISQNETKKVIMLYERALEINKDKKNSHLYKLIKGDLENLNSMER